MSAVNVLAVLDARIARLKQALANDEIALVPANYRTGVTKLHRNELDSTEAARVAVAELIEATAFLSGELLRKYGGTAVVGESRVRAALAHVEGVA